MNAFPHVKEEVDFPNVLFSSETHPDGQTGATAFSFPSGAWLAVDARGGSVASSETSLLEPGSYSSQVDAVVFAGGSTMGLEAADGFRAALFAERVAQRGSVQFDDIPAVPGAVVYDYSFRAPGKGATSYPDLALGKKLRKSLSPQFLSGRAGAGLFTSANKMNPAATYFSGQGLAWQSYDWGQLLFAVVLNPLGDLWLEGKPLSQRFGQPLGAKEPDPKTNTTLSLVLTDVALSRAQIQRFSSMAHAALAACIQPFHTPYDGDVLFAGSVTPSGSSTVPEISLKLAAALPELAKAAVAKAVYSAQGLETPQAQQP
jgi:L-aminopeptidase/D-esterase-like protein